MGKGDDKPRLEEKVKKMGVGDCVEFYGFVSTDQLSLIYSKADVFIMPSKVSLEVGKPEGEGFGIVFIEAAMHNLPLIGPTIGGSTDIIEDQINGLECNPTSAVDISQKMLILLNDKNKRLDYGKKAKEKVLNNFTLEQLDNYLAQVVKE